MRAVTTVLMSPSRCGGASQAVTMTPKNGQKRSSTGRAAPAVPPFLRKPPAVAPRGATKQIPAGIKTTMSAPAVWPVSGPEKPRRNNVRTSAPDVRKGTTNAAAAGPWGARSVLPESPLLRELKMPPSPPAAVQRRAVQRRTEGVPAPTRAPRATPGVLRNRPWPRTAPPHSRPPWAGGEYRGVLPGESGRPCRPRHGRGWRGVRRPLLQSRAQW